jgi:hypothetical protein
MSLDLHELKEIEHEFIKEIIYKYNELEFYTFTSQPGKIQYLKSGEIRKQRSYIRGYMNVKMSQFIISKLSNYSRIFVRDEQNNKIIDPKFECNCGSVIFIDGKPGTMDFDVGDFYQSFNLGLPLRRSYKWYLENICDFEKCDLIPSNLDTETTTEFDIMCLNWDTNDMWKILLDIIIEYHKNI